MCFGYVDNSITRDNIYNEQIKIVLDNKIWNKLSLCQTGKIPIKWICLKQDKIIMSFFNNALLQLADYTISYNINWSSIAYSEWI